MKLDQKTLRLTQVLWDYMVLGQQVEKADCIVGFGCYNEDVARRAAQLYHQGYAPRILFTGALGRNTRNMWIEGEAERFARIAVQEGVPKRDILLEQRASNSGENLIFSRRLLLEAGFPAPRIIGVQKPYMERRLYPRVLAGGNGHGDLLAADTAGIPCGGVPLGENGGRYSKHDCGRLPADGCVRPEGLPDTPGDSAESMGRI